MIKFLADKYSETIMKLTINFFSGLDDFMAYLGKLSIAGQLTAPHIEMEVYKTYLLFCNILVIGY